MICLWKTVKKRYLNFTQSDRMKSSMQWFSIEYALALETYYYPWDLILCLLQTRKKINTKGERTFKCHNLHYITLYFKRIIFIPTRRTYISKEGIKFKYVKMDYIIKWINYIKWSNSISSAARKTTSKR